MIPHTLNLAPVVLLRSPVEITFPAFDRAAHSRGDKRTAPSSISIDKYVSKERAMGTMGKWHGNGFQMFSMSRCVKKNKEKPCKPPS
jgi:hypothetical protein